MPYCLSRRNGHNCPTPLCAKIRTDTAKGMRDETMWKPPLALLGLLALAAGALVLWPTTSWSHPGGNVHVWAGSTGGPHVAYSRPWGHHHHWNHRGWPYYYPGAYGVGWWPY